MKAQRESDQRPWITVQAIIPTSGIDDSSHPSFSMDFNLKNIGNTPAQVFLKTKLVDGAYSGDFKTVRQRWEKIGRQLCADAKDKMSERWDAPWVVFPGDRSFPYYVPDLRFDVGTLAQYRPRLIGCVIYRNSQQPQNIHSTPFWAWISHEKAVEKPPIGAGFPFKADGQPVTSGWILVKDLRVAGFAD